MVNRLLVVRGKSTNQMKLLSIAFVLISIHLNNLFASGFHNVGLINKSRKNSSINSLQPTILFQASSNDYDGDDDEYSNDIEFELSPDATPIFEEKPATLFGLEPKAELDPLDSGLTFTGPVILLVSIYITISLWVLDDVDPLDVL